jgi:hypothetical protein
MELIFRASWADYEESFVVEIFKQNDKYYVKYDGHCVLDPNAKSELEEISHNEALEIMLEYADIEDEEITYKYNL